jgi:hypothetical protein
MASQTTSTHKFKGSVNRRARLLADRIENGAANLAAFAERLSETEWLNRYQVRTGTLSAHPHGSGSINSSQRMS